ncbi:MAG TPA: amidohydrolase family protein [Phycisphaerales bacterium]|nr:amidohydrolase family protein [Phycisphaerales bacterium]
MKRTSILALLLLSSTTQAQDLGHKAPPQSQPITITNVTIHTVAGADIRDGTLAFDRGTITGVGPVSPVAGARVIDGKGLHVYPGLIGANTLMGLTEVNAARATIDFSETGDVTPEVRAAVAVNPDSTIIPVTRSNGVLVTALLPMGGSIPGRASVIRLEGWTWEDMAIRDDAGMVVNWPGVRPIRSRFTARSEEDQTDETRAARDRIEDAFSAAAAYVKTRDADSSVPVNLQWEAMRRVLERKAPVFIRANQVDQIQSAVNWAVGRNLRTIIVGGADAPLAADLLKKYDIPVIVTGTFSLPRRGDAPYDDSYTLPARLEAAGVRWCLASIGGGFETPHERNLPYHAAMAVAYGLDPKVALRSITLSPAEILGISDKYGSVEIGRSATFIVTDGDPLEITTQVKMAFIDGREIDLTDKQKALNEKYLEKYRQSGLIDREHTNSTTANSGQ